MFEMSSWTVRAGRLAAHLGRTLLMVGSLGLGACKSGATAAPAPEPSSSLFLELRSLTGEPVPGARVSLSSGEQLQSDTWGQLLWPRLPPGRQLLRAEAPGFAPSLRALDVGEGVQAGTRLEMLPLGTPVARFDTRKGEAFEKNKIRVTVPAGEQLFDAEGRVLQGRVEAYLAPLDLEHLEKAELLAAPGELRGVLHTDEPPVNLESVAFMVLTFRQEPGASPGAEAEQDPRVTPLARHQGIRVSVPRSVLAHALPPSGDTAELAASQAPDAAPSEVPLWRLDTTTGLWVPTGDVAKPSNGGQTYEITLEHPAPLIHAARPFADHPRAPSAPQTQFTEAAAPAWRQTACLAVRVVDEKGQAVAGRAVVALGLDYASVSRAVTGGDGRARLEVMRDREVRLDAGPVTRLLHTSAEAGTCTGQGAAPKEITLPVPAPQCVPGATRDCAYTGPEGVLGTGICRAAHNVCDVNGGEWSATCQGEVLPQPEQCDNTRDDNCDGRVNEDCPSLCTPGERQSCYEGPEGTRDVGVCRGGTRTCAPSGTAWSECEGQVLPATEDCFRPEDENCDGTACQCWPDEQQACPYGGPAGTQGVGSCHAGTQLCDITGTGWNACTGEVRPQAEDCANAVDDDCTGQADDASYCLCRPGESEECPYSGPAGSKGVGACHAGSRTCEPSGMAWGACQGERVPQTEVCSQPGDEDCDGSFNEPPCLTQDLVLPRALHLATLLKNGKVLVTGGQNNGSVYKSAQLYDPATQTWSSAGDMASPRYAHTATRLKDGKVLVSGGRLGPSSGDNLLTAEVYDPDLNTWSPTGSMGSLRSGHTATLLTDGKILVTGGATGAVHLMSAEVFNPGTGTWTAVGSMPTSHVRHTATLLHSGKVLVAGGEQGENNYAKKAALFDTTTGWSAVPDLKVARARHSAVLLRDGRILVVGGHNSGGVLSSSEIYDPDGNDWQNTTAMSTPRDNPAAVLLSDGRVLVTGGTDDAQAQLNTAELYEPVTGIWSSVEMIQPRATHTATLLQDGQVLIVGGTNTQGTQSSTELYAPPPSTLHNVWTALRPMTQNRYLHTTTVLKNGQVLVVGGVSSGGTYLQSAEVYDPVDNTWSPTNPLQTTPRAMHTATVLPDGKVLIAGGRSDSSTYLQSAEVYDPAAGTWSSANPLVGIRAGHTATVLLDGKVLVVGGQSDNSTELLTAEVYDPVAKSWSSTTNSLMTARAKHTAALLSDGRVIVSGGFSDNYYRHVSEVYNPVTNSWARADDLVSYRSQHTATSLGKGKVLVSGGRVNASRIESTAEVYDSASDAWSSIGSMKFARHQHTATRLDNGQIFVVGGLSGLNAASALNAVELYIP